MKRIEAIIRPDKVSDVCTALDNVGHPGVTLTHIEEQGDQQGWVNHVRAISHTVRLLNKVRVEVVAKDDDLDMLLKTIRDAAWTGEAGDGTMFVNDMADAIRIRTSESGISAI
jgi:nitrogen regulatory protein P-II 1